MEMGFRWDFAYEILPQMLWATLNTIIAAGVGYAIALIVGLFFLLGQRTPSKIINGINREIVEFIRSTPLLIQLFFVYFVLPQFGIKLSAWVCGMITIGLHFGTYLSEVYRGALEGVSKTQWEACRALNFSTAYTYRRIVLPQAFPIAIPTILERLYAELVSSRGPVIREDSFNGNFEFFGYIELLPRLISREFSYFFKVSNKFKLIRRFSVRNSYL